MGCPRHPLAVPLDHQDSLAPGAVAFMVGGAWVVVDMADWLRLAELGPYLRWTTGSTGGREVPYLSHPLFGRMIAARVIVGARQDQAVVDRNGNAWDLRRANLIVSPRRFTQPRRVPLPMID